MNRTTFFLSKHEAEKLTARVNAGQEPSFVGKTVLISVDTPINESLMLISPLDPAVNLIIKERGGSKSMDFNKPHDAPAVDSPHWIELLRLSFNDVDPNHCSDEWKSQWTLFDDSMADLVIDLLDRTKDNPNAQTFAVHCHAGISRSAAISKFIAVYHNLQFPESYSLYNKHVFSTLMRRWRQRQYGQELWT